MNVGTLEIQMAMDLARLRQDMNASKSIVSSTMGDINKVIGYAKTAFVAFAGVSGVSAFAGMINGAIEAQGALHDMSKATGLSVAALGEFRKIGAYTETSTEAIAGAALKLSKNLALADEDGKGAALAIKALGLNFDAFAKLNPEQRMLAAAKALDQYEDGADKSAAAMLLFGKEGAKMLPFLADLAQSSDEINAKLTDQEKATRAAAAAMADNYGDNLTKIQKQSESWKKELAMGLLPAMWETTEAFLQVAGGAGGVKDQISKLANDGTLAEWARMGVTGLSYLLDVGQGLLTLFPMVGKTLAGLVAAGVQGFTAWHAALTKLTSGDFSGAIDEIKGGFNAVKTIGTDTAEDISKLWNQKLIGESFRDSMSSLRGVQAESKEAKKQLALTDVLAANEAAKKAEAAATKAAAEEQKKLIAAYEAADKAGQDLIQALALKNDQLQLEVELGRKLTPVEQENLKLTTQLTSGKVLLSKADEEAARAAIEHGAALEREIAWQQESHKSNLALIESTDKRIEQLRDETDKQRLANAEMGLTTEQLGEVRKAKLLDLAVQAERKAALLDEIDWTGQLGDQQRELAQAYRDSAQVAGESAGAKAAKEAQDAWQKTIDSIGQGLTDSLFRAFESGKGFFKTLWDGIVNTFKTTVLKLVISGTDGKGGIVGTVMDAVGLGSGKAGSSGSSGGSLLSSLASWGSLAKSAYGWLGGGSAAAGAQWGTVAYSNAVGAMGGDSLGALISSNAGNWGVSVGAGSGAGSGAGAGAGASASTSWIPIVGAIIAGIMTSAAAFDQGYSADKTTWGQDTLFGTQKLNTNLWEGIVGEKWANALTGASLTNKLINWGAGTPHRGGMYVSDGVHGYVPADRAVGSRATGDSVHANRSQGVEDAVAAVTTGAAGLLNEMGKLWGQAESWLVGGYFSADADDASMGDMRIWKNLKTMFSKSANFASDPQTGFKEFTVSLAGEVRRAMDTIDMPKWAKEQIDALASTSTMEDLAKTFSAIAQTKQALADMGDAFKPLGGAFGRIAALSSDAQMGLVKLAGGLDKLLAAADNYVGLYFTDVERASLSAIEIRKALSDVGLNADSLATKEQFRALVDSTDVSTETGQKQLLALLGVAGSFADVAAVLADAGGTLGSIAAAAPGNVQTQIVDLLKEPTLASAQAAEQSAQLLATANDQLASISDASEASVRVMQAGFTQLIERVEALTEQMDEVLRPGHLSQLSA